MVWRSREAGKDVAKVGKRIDAVEFRCLDQRCQTRPMLRPAITAREQCVFAGQSLRPDGALDRIRIKFDTPILNEQAQPLPSR